MTSFTSGPAATRPALAPFLHRLQSTFQLVEAEYTLLQSLADSTHALDVGAVIRYSSEAEAWILASGWAGFERTLSNGLRQIFSFVLPGDTLGISDALYEGAARIVAVTPLRLVRADRLKRAVENKNPDYPSLVAACELERTARNAQALDHMVRLGRLSALARTAHLLLELHQRLDTAGLARDGMFELPLSQSVIGEALGLSLVHVNRTFQALRSERLLDAKQGHAALLDRQNLAEIAGMP